MLALFYLCLPHFRPLHGTGFIQDEYNVFLPFCESTWSKEMHKITIYNLKIPILENLGTKNTLKKFVSNERP